jgi:hypothetical protein
MYAHVATPHLSESRVGAMHDAMLLDEGAKEEFVESLRLSIMYRQPMSRT